MERLTVRRKDGRASIENKMDRNTPLQQAMRIPDVIDRLAAIEDILGDDYDLDRLRELVEADREGRCVVLSEPMKPMVCKPNESDVFCPNCGETLSGGWPQSDADDHRKMCQCPKCGQSIDDETCVVEELEQDG